MTTDSPVQRPGPGDGVSASAPTSGRPTPDPAATGLPTSDHTTVGAVATGAVTPGVVTAGSVTPGVVTSAAVPATVLAAAVAALAGLVLDGVYAGGRHGTGAEATAAMLRGFDLVTLLVAVPVLGWATTGVRRTSVPARLVAAGVLAYLGYTYAYYVLGTPMTDLLLLHVAVLAGSMVALIGALPGLGTATATTPDRPRRATRGAALTLGTLGAALGGMWVAVCLVSVVTGAVPDGSLLVESDQVVQLGIVLDLTVLVPLYGAAAVLLWRGARWGVALGAVALVAGLLHQASYLAALVAQDLAGVPGAVAFDPVEPVIVSLYLAGAVMLFHALRRSVTSTTAGDVTGVTRSVDT